MSLRPFPSIQPNYNGTNNNGTYTGTADDSGILSNLSLLFYFIAAIGVFSAIFYTIHTSRRDRKANRRRREEETRRREAALQPLTYRPQSDDEVSPPQYFAHELDQPYVGPETLILYPDDVLYGGQVPIPADGATGLSENTTATQQSQDQLNNNPASAHRHSAARAASPNGSSSNEVAIDIPAIAAPSPALSHDSHSTIVAMEDGVENSNNGDGRQRRRVTFGGHRLSVFDPRRLLHHSRRGSHHSNTSSTTLHRRSSSTSSHHSRHSHDDDGSHNRHSSVSSMEMGLENSATRPTGPQRTASSISALVDAIQVPQPAMVETTRTSYPPVLYRLRSQGPPPYVADVRPEDAPPLPPDYSAVVSDTASTCPSTTSPASPSAEQAVQIEDRH
ncbi:hypothetical protein BGW41_002588 [Actinomortierella wolfii]|nr:hypothetical protein BGW41_002588 [Actinomortierella wolfii]